MMKSKWTILQEKLLYFCITIAIFMSIYLSGFFFMQFLAFAMEVHPYVSFTFYIFLWIIDTIITKKLMLSKFMIYWILKKY